MYRSLTLGQQNMINLALIFAILATIGVFAQRSTQQVLGAKNTLAQTHTRIVELTSLRSALEETETGERGFVITGQDEFLAPYEAGKEAATRHLAQLPTLFGNDPAQAQPFAELRPLVEDRLRELEEIIQIRKKGGFEEAQKAISATQRRKGMERIRKLTDGMKRREQEVLAARRTELEEASTGMFRMLGGGIIVLVVIIGVISASFIIPLSRKLSAAIQRIQSACAELEATAAQQSRGAKAQVSAATEVSTTMRELVATSRQIAESAQHVTSAADETAAAAEGGTQTVAGAQHAMEAVRGQVDRIVDHMLDLGKRSQQIGGILDIINELAEQTNILAINATIEAVGAGEAGRRFGVVASEIRKLADRVGGSTKEIRRLIEEIRAAANTTVMATEDGAKAAEAGARRYAEVTQSFRRIADLVFSTAQASREIVLSTKQQTSAMEQVSSAIGDVAQTARESESGTSQTAHTSAELASLSRELGQIIDRAAPTAAAA